MSINEAPGYRDSADPPKQLEWWNQRNTGIVDFVPADDDELALWREYALARAGGTAQENPFSQVCATFAARMVIYERRLRARMEPK